ncbi:MAG: hypothetical protein Kow00109_29940 [Acidobacteriota bacterium]
MGDAVIEHLERLRVFPVVVLDSPEQAEPLGEALLAAGMSCVELTFRTAAAEEGLRRLSRRYPELLLGAGTVLNVDQARRAQDAGAKFMVSPGFCAAVVDYCLLAGISVFPGVMTPTEMQWVLERRLGVAKFFPAEAAGGVGFLKAVAGPFQGLRFIPTGGIRPGNLPEYLAQPNVLACAGTWLVGRSDLQAADYEAIRRKAAEALRIARGESGS